jgi:hypothetical protein
LLIGDKQHGTGMDEGQQLERRLFFLEPQKKNKKKFLRTSLD